MKLDEIILILNNYIRTLETAKGVAYGNGDLESYSQIEAKILETQVAIGGLLEQ
jgi:hypothetical protein